MLSAAQGAEVIDDPMMPYLRVSAHVTPDPLAP